MNHRLTYTAALVALFAAVAQVVSVIPASARGGAANLLNSPGYQRALEESRKRQAEPYLKPATVYPRKKWRHRGRRH